MKAENSNKFLYLESFIKAGLSENQALVYEMLLKLGKVPASKIHNSTPLKKGLLYKVLEELADLGLITIHEKAGKVTTFEPMHPDNLKKLLETKSQEVQNSLSALDNIWLNVTQDFNLIASRPTVQFFEGIEGVHKVTNDTLTATGTIYSYIDYDAMDKYMPVFNDAYVDKRIRLKINKQILAVDTEYARKRVANKPRTYREVRFIKSSLPFSTLMQIYNNKISYVTLSENKKIGVIIEDPYITGMHKALFESAWEKARS